MCSCSTTSTCVGRAPPLRLLVSTNDFSSYPLNLLCPGLRADETCQLQVSSIMSMRDQYASPVRKGDIYKYAFLCIFITAILSNCPTLSTDSPSMCRLGLFSRTLCSGSDAKFCQCLPCCSPGRHPLCLLPRRVSGEQRGGAAEILRRIWSRAWANEPSLHILGWDQDLSLPISMQVAWT